MRVVRLSAVLPFTGVSFPIGILADWGQGIKVILCSTYPDSEFLKRSAGTQHDWLPDLLEDMKRTEGKSLDALMAKEWVSTQNRVFPLGRAWVCVTRDTVLDETIWNLDVYAASVLT